MGLVILKSWFMIIHEPSTSFHDLEMIISMQTHQLCMMNHGWNSMTGKSESQLLDLVEKSNLSKNHQFLFNFNERELETVCISLDYLLVGWMNWKEGISLKNFTEWFGVFLEIVLKLRSQHLLKLETSNIGNNISITSKVSFRCYQLLCVAPNRTVPVVYHVLHLAIKHFKAFTHISKVNFRKIMSV